MTISSRSLCLHHNFGADVRVARLEDVGRFLAECHVKCTDCGEPFRFVGVPSGVNLLRPMASIDGLELRAPIEPRGDSPMLATKASFTMPDKKIDVDIIEETIAEIRAKARDAADSGVPVLIVLGAKLDAWANTIGRAIRESTPS